MAFGDLNGSFIRKEGGALVRRGFTCHECVSSASPVCGTPVASRGRTMAATGGGGGVGRHQDLKRWSPISSKNASSGCFRCLVCSKAPRRCRERSGGPAGGPTGPIQHNNRKASSWPSSRLGSPVTIISDSRKLRRNALVYVYLSHSEFY